MTSPEADSFRGRRRQPHPGRQEKGEGAFYVWTKAEIDEMLGPDAALFNRVYGVEPRGNSPGQRSARRIEGPEYPDPPPGTATFDLETAATARAMPRKAP